MPSNTRIGHIMRGIQRAFITEPDKAWSTAAAGLMSNARDILLSLAQ
jgi:hypothetical protein